MFLSIATPVSTTVVVGVLEPEVIATAFQVVSVPAEYRNPSVLQFGVSVAYRVLDMMLVPSVPVPPLFQQARPIQYLALVVWVTAARISH
jgi:hypothetical protein